MTNHQKLVIAVKALKNVEHWIAHSHQEVDGTLTPRMQILQNLITRAQERIGEVK